MSRNIPKVRGWKVTYYHGEKKTSVTVQTINKRFARWAARDYLGFTNTFSADKITVALERSPK